MNQRFLARPLQRQPFQRQPLQRQSFQRQQQPLHQQKTISKSPGLVGNSIAEKLSNVPDFHMEITPSPGINPFSENLNSECDLFLKTYHGDYKWLPYVYRSILKFVTGFRQLILVYDQGHGLPPSPPTGIRVKMFAVNPLVALPGVSYSPSTGYFQQQAIKMMWNYFTDAAYVFMIDSDTIFTSHFHKNNIFDGDKMYQNYRDFPGGDSVIWKPSIDLMYGSNSPYDFMPRQGFAYNRISQIHFLKHVEKLVHGSPYKLIRRPDVFLPSEFNMMGAFNFMYEQSRYTFTTNPKWSLNQEWSWGGLTPEIQQKMNGILS